MYCHLPTSLPLLACITVTTWLFQNSPLSVLNLTGQA